ncbi:MAG TPA: hypothetical protein VLE73_05620 [Candidatus Saccharimonadales bacterium]|nr:hypothetical protein [Candidatus Saccharimonadales bacterium]
MTLRRSELQSLLTDPERPGFRLRLQALARHAGQRVGALAIVRVNNELQVPRPIYTDDRKLQCVPRSTLDKAAARSNPIELLLVSRRITGKKPSPEDLLPSPGTTCHPCATE